MRLALPVFGLAAALLVSAFVIGGGGTATALQSATVTMSAATGPDGGGSQPGTATLTASGNQTEVVINIDASPDGADVEQPVHIHSGTCDNLPGSLGAVEYPLTNVVNGTSTTTVDASLDSLQTGNFAVNVHKSGTEVGVYVSCGNIPASGAAQVPTTGGPPPSGGGLAPAAYLLIAAGALALAGAGSLALAALRRR